VGAHEVHHALLVGEDRVLGVQISGKLVGFPQVLVQDQRRLDVAGGLGVITQGNQGFGEVLVGDRVIVSFSSTLA